MGVLTWYLTNTKMTGLENSIFSAVNTAYILTYISRIFRQIKANSQEKGAFRSFLINLWCSQMRFTFIKYDCVIFTPTNPWRNFRHIEWKLIKQQSFPHDGKKCQNFYPFPRSLLLIRKLSAELKLFGMYHSHGTKTSYKVLSEILKAVYLNV